MMCGIALAINGTIEEVQQMGQAIKSRGITSNITQIDDVIVYFTYLPITDLDAPTQPYEYGQYLVYLNGFISNWKELSIKYKIDLQSNCDTELLAKFIAGTGLGKLSELNGFFSIVVYDKEAKRLHSFTDRYGCKQLYQVLSGSTLYIASEVKALLAVLPLEISERAADDWLYSLGVMTEDTIYKSVKRVPCLPFIQPKPIQISYTQAKDQLEYLLNQSMIRNKVHGLKDGVFLSGGVDSGILASKLNPDYCFSMDYQDQAFSEIENIKLNSTGIHMSMICNRDLFEKYKDKAADVLDDLKAGSCYTNFALTELASNFCTVLYSGAGGDEVFDGYEHRYNRSMNEVIKRDNFKCYRLYPEITHKEYDWKFLRAVLVVEDRMTGWHTMETRYPFLDNDLVDFALSLPPSYRHGKAILKDISGLSDEVVQGKKIGFSNPYMTNYEWAQFALQQHGQNAVAKV